MGRPHKLQVPQMQAMSRLESSKNSLQSVADRDKVLAEVKEQGTASIHSYGQKGLKGRNFCISNGVMWNIENALGVLQHLLRKAAIIACACIVGPSRKHRVCGSLKSRVHAI